MNAIERILLWTSVIGFLVLCVLLARHFYKETRKKADNEETWNRPIPPPAPRPDTQQEIVESESQRLIPWLFLLVCTLAVYFMMGFAFEVSLGSLFGNAFIPIAVVGILALVDYSSSITKRTSQNSVKSAQSISHISGVFHRAGRDTWQKISKFYNKPENKD